MRNRCNVRSLSDMLVFVFLFQMNCTAYSKIRAVYNGMLNNINNSKNTTWSIVQSEGIRNLFYQTRHSVPPFRAEA